ncbi:hypothetical protein TCAL_12957 [Tigriopus californicus]|uniref:Caprin-1 dimerization domain-containing protein n=1 Tax=Tigriopus californicus TaxID=6832 RepID=A0A553P7I3_TIGCA|nr:hypothetical protein TCAL_12957 [Tigriopus californicus]|eukprot:TCALIF_12957-PA protein Name:"Similar to CAPRIN1 Caprin-1 (Homo sapiens)" AED:0.02 eAED:0.02 QI:94/0.5/0.66/1/0.5/1/3/727/725
MVAMPSLTPAETPLASGAMVGGGNSINGGGSEATSSQTVDESPLGQALQIVEKKVRNLEKRKGKLDGYRADYQRGKTLNDDQKAAIAKYDEDLLKALGNFKTRADFVNGNHGAVKIAKEQMDLVKEFENLVRPARKNFAQGEDFEKALTVAAEHLSNLVDGKSKKVLGKTSYKELKTLFHTIKTCGYFEGKAMKDSENVEEELPSSSGSEEGDRIPTDAIKTTKTDKHGKQPPMANGKASETAHVRGSKTGTANGEKSKGKAHSANNNNNETNPQTSNTKAQDQPMPNPQMQQPKQARAPKGVPARDAPQEVQEQQHPPPQHIHQQQNHNHQQHEQPLPARQQQQQQQQQQAPAVATQMVPPQPQPQPLMQQKPSHPPHPLPASLPQIPAKPEIDFLQESQIGLDSPHMDPAVVVVQHSAPEGGPMNLHHPTPMMMTPTTLAAIQQHQHALSQMHHHHMLQQHYNQQQQQHQLESMVKKPAPGFAERPHPGPPPMTEPALQSLSKHHEPMRTSPMLDNDIPIAPTPAHSVEPVSEPAPVAAPLAGPVMVTAPASAPAAPVASGYAAIAAGSNKAGSQEPVVDTMSNIADWNSEVNNGQGEDREVQRGETYRGRGGRGGRGGGDRGDRGDRRPYRGGRGGYGGERGGRGGTGEKRGYGDRGSGYRGNRGGERGRGGGDRGGERGGYRGREDRGDRSYRGGGYRGGRGAERGGGSGEHGGQRGQNGY